MRQVTVHRSHQCAVTTVNSSRFTVISRRRRRVSFTVRGIQQSTTTHLDAHRAVSLAGHCRQRVVLRLGCREARLVKARPVVTVGQRSFFQFRLRQIAQQHATVGSFFLQRRRRNFVKTRRRLRILSTQKTLKSVDWQRIGQRLFTLWHR